MSILYFSKPFNSKYKTIITNTAIKEISNKFNLEMSSDPSYEGGFNLPFNEKWRSFDFGSHLNNIMFKYHNSRQLRYYTNGIDHDTIIGLRFKDGINYWDQYEIDILLNTVNNLLNKLESIAIDPPSPQCLLL
jgi:hypothetical protein